MKPKIIAVVGPTASGKTDLAIALAKALDGEVISADSRQVYRGMDIGTAKARGSVASSEKRGGSISTLFGGGAYLDVEEVPHWGIDIVDPDEDYSVSDFKEYAEARIREVLDRGRLPILVGGTGLWIQAVVDNLTLTEVPPDPELRAELEQEHVDTLFHEYKRLDPEGAEMIDRHNKRRLVRALEVTKKSGIPFSELRQAGEPEHDVLMLGLSVPREELRARIDARVDRMVADGLIDEVRGLKERYGCDAPAMSGIGYRELCGYFAGDMPLEEAIAEIKKNTRRFARRQETWFKRDERIAWVESAQEAIQRAQAFLR